MSYIYPQNPNFGGYQVPPPNPTLVLAEAIKELATAVQALAQVGWAKATAGDEWGPAEDLAARAEVARRDHQRESGT